MKKSRFADRLSILFYFHLEGSHAIYMSKSTKSKFNFKTLYDKSRLKQFAFARFEGAPDILYEDRIKSSLP